MENAFAGNCSEQAGRLRYVPQASSLLRRNSSASFRNAVIGLILFIAGVALADPAITPEYLEEHLNPTLPRMVLTPDAEQLVKKKIQTDPVVSNMYSIIRLQAEEIQTKPLLERIKEGRRLLAVSRELLYRINMLGMVYRMEKDPKVLNRINDEITAVCNFSDWNHQEVFLDVTEMSMGVSLALDWTAGDLPPETIELAKTTLIEKAIKPSFEDATFNWWIDVAHNWSQVCHGGLIAAAITVADCDSQLASKTIQRALDCQKNPLSMYAPDGVYPEGPGYWEYGSGYSAVTISLLETAFGTDFGLSEFPGFMESAVFRRLTETPNGYYNFSDCPSRSGRDHFGLVWFASRTGNSAFYRKDRFLRSPDEMGKLGSFMGVGLIWLAQFEPKMESVLPSAWCGRGDKPVVVFRNGDADPRHYYFAAIGGKAKHNHGNMDGGGFIFELDGVRWGIECGSPRYHDLEKVGFDQWTMTQDAQRWTLLCKNNFGHSTLTVNGQHHLVDGKTELIDFKADETPNAVFDMTPVFGDLVDSARRTFIKDSPISLIVEDKIKTSEKTEQITWQFMTTADAEVVPDGVILKEDGKTLKLQNLSHSDIPFIVVSLDPPPMKLDRRIKNLKRIELRVPVPKVGKNVTVKIRLCGSENLTEKENHD